MGLVGRKRVGGEIFLICWECGQRVKEDHSRFPDTELEMRQGCGWERAARILDLMSSRRGVGLPFCLQPTVALGGVALELAWESAGVGVWDKRGEGD